MESTAHERAHTTAAGGLTVRDASVRRGGRLTLDRVSFTLAPGEILAVIGANGAGKTTLLDAVVGNIRLSAGTIEFRSQPLRGFAARARVFSLMPDAAEPADEVRVAVLIEYARRFGRWPVEQARALSERLGLTRFEQARAGELSRGEKRRIALFAALCTDRPVVVLDEPLGVFDPLQLLGVLGVLRDRARAGTALLLSVHQLSDAEKIADRILILDRGRAIASGTFAELRTQVAQPDASLEAVFMALLERTHAAA